jgi:crossover junction endodeoxyribonuclease RuvC
MKQEDRIILGIDPGTTILGYGIISCRSGKMSLLCMGNFQLSKLGDHGLKLKEIQRQVTALIESYLPDEMAIEAPFYGKNVQSMLKLGRAQGVAIAAAMAREIPYTEYAPKKIKQAITGNGNASKEQVAAMLQSLLKIETLPKNLDATDGLAAAVCHFFNRGQVTGAGTHSGWKSFLGKNPHRKIG